MAKKATIAVKTVISIVLFFALIVPSMGVHEPEHK